MSTAILSKLEVPGSRAESSPQPTTIGELLPLAAARFPGARVGFMGASDATAEVLSLPELLLEARRLLGGLRALGRTSGENVVLLLERAREFLPAWWACVLGGFVPCPLAPVRNDPLRWARHLQHIDRLLDHPPVVVAADLLEELPAGLPQSKTVTLEMLRGAAPVSVSHQADGHDPAVLMLTSGSTGNSKAVVLTHRNLLASMRGKQLRQQLSTSDISLNWISFDHVAALLEIHLISLYAGASQYHVEPAAILADPWLFLRLIDRYRVSLTFAPNFLLGQLNGILQTSSRPGQERPLDLSCVRHIISGGEANVVRTGQRFLTFLSQYGLPRTAVRPAFGMTETCAGAIYSDVFPDCDAGWEFASVGHPITGLQMRVVKEDGTVSLPGETGELQLRGDMIFTGYYNDAAATRAAFTLDGWLRTGDLGRIDLGRLSLVGRAKESIIVSGVNYFSHEVEAAVESLEGIERSCVAAFPTRPEGADTEQLVVAFAPLGAWDDESRLHRLAIAVRNTVIALWGFRPALALPLPRECFPKTSLGKIQRSLLRKRLEAGELAAHVERIAAITARQHGAYLAPCGAAETAVAEMFAEVLGIEVRSVGASASFFDLGGTSLDIFKLKRALERGLDLLDVPLVTILQSSTVRALAARMSEHNRRLTRYREDPVLPALTRSYDPLVPLQITGSKTPLFCMHPGTGEILGFLGLAQYFAAERPFYALRARGFNADEPHFGTFEEMIASYTVAIRARQPRGPYALAGYSFGAAVAFEVAKALERSGERVAFIGCIDGTPYIGDPQDRLDFIGSTVVVAFFLGLLDKGQLWELPAQIRAAGRDPCEVIVGLASAARLSQLNLDPERFAAWADLAYSLVRIGEAYEPGGTVESVTVFYAEPLRGAKQEWLDSQLRRWDDFTRAPNRYVEVAGEHDSLLGPKHVAGFQAVLVAELARALQE
jgi:acyl-CoA synthetase (AMP-forming)/AMP-acid ligase II/thioesterase domain-containing protein